MLNKLSKIDRLTIDDHSYLSEDDEVWYFGEYSAGRRFDFSPANQLITNLKHGVEHRGTPRWRHKVSAIDSVGRALSQRIKAQSLTQMTFVPIPPSEARGDAGYDSRNVDILNAFNGYTGNSADVRELLYQTESTRKSHQSDDRLTQQELLDVYRIDEQLAAPTPQMVVLFDDMLTNGTHFLAARHVIQLRFPGVRVIGIVVCRRKPANPFEDLED